MINLKTLKYNLNGAAKVCGIDEWKWKELQRRQFFNQKSMNIQLNLGDVTQAFALDHLIKF